MPFWKFLRVPDTPRTDRLVPHDLNVMDRPLFRLTRKLRTMSSTPDGRCTTSGMSE